jgi:hypothetical protein
VLNYTLCDSRDKYISFYKSTTKSPSARQYIRNALNVYSGGLQFKTRLGYTLVEDFLTFPQALRVNEVKCHKIMSHNSVLPDISNVYVRNM